VLRDALPALPALGRSAKLARALHAVPGRRQLRLPRSLQQGAGPKCGDLLLEQEEGARTGKLPTPVLSSPAGAPQRGVPSTGKLPGPMQPRARGKPIPYRAAFSGQAGAGRGARARLVDHGLQRAALRRAAQRVQRRGLRLQAAQAAQPGPESRRAACRARDAVQQRHLRARVSAPHPRRLIRHHQEMDSGLGLNLTLTSFKSLDERWSGPAALPCGRGWQGRRARAEASAQRAAR